MLLTGAKIIMECLIEQDADIVFGFPGGAALNIYDALYGYPAIRHVLSCHEQHAAHAADGYARATAKTGVVLSTSGPGATNLVTGIATAHMDSVPLVAITSNVARPLLGKDSFQEIDIFGVTAPITKHNIIVRSPADLADAIREAFYIAQSGRKGPVLVDVPKDISARTAEYTYQKPKQPSHCNRFSNDDIRVAAEAIEKSRRPFIYAGGGVIAAGASDALYEFAKRVGAPVSTSLMGIGAYPQNDAGYTGMIGMHGTKVSALCIDSCDLLIAVGARFSDRVTCDKKKFAKQAKVLHIDVDPAEISKNIRADYEISGDAKDVLEILSAHIPAQDNAEWLSDVQKWKEEYPLTYASDAAQIPAHIIREVQRAAPNDTIYTTEVGQHQMWAAQFLNIEYPRQFFTSGGLGTMGFGLGAGIGAAYGTGRRTVVFAGDGSFNMNFAELITAVKYKVPVTVVVLNNHVLGMVRQWQKLFYDNRFSHTTLGDPINYELLGRALNVPAYVVEDPLKMADKAERALNCEGPSLMVCNIDEDENVLPMIPGDMGYQDQVTEMDDMA